MLASLLCIVGLPAVAVLGGQLFAVMLRLSDEDGIVRLFIRGLALAAAAWLGGGLWWRAVVSLGDQALQKLSTLG